MIKNRVDITGLKNDGLALISLNEVQIKEIYEFKRRLQMGEYRELLIDTCNLCQYPNAALIAEKDRYGLPVKTVVCDMCGLVRTLNPLDKESSYRFYAEQYRNMYEGSTFNSRKRQQNLMERFRGDSYSTIIKKIKLDSSTLVAEIGAAAGWNLYSFHKRGIPVIGCDLDRDNLNYGREKGLNLLEGTIDVMIEAGVQADFIFLNNVIEHILDPVQLMFDIRKILKENGYVHISAPGLLGVRYGYGDGEFWGCLQNAHTYFFELFTLKQCMLKAGFAFVWGDEWMQGLFRKKRDTAPYSPTKKMRGAKVAGMIKTLRLSEKMWKMVWKLLGGNSLTRKGRIAEIVAYSIIHPKWALPRVRERLVQKVI